ncbi:MAG: hypothetical protein ACKV2V_12055 [Blastocatellia bacterium]
MRQHFNLILDQFRRVLTFVEERRNDFIDSETARNLFTRLGDLHEDLRRRQKTLSQERETQTTDTTKRGELRTQLRDALAAISRTAQALKRRQMELPGRFTLPRKYNDQELLATAELFLAQAEPLAAEFIAYRMPADFVASLRGMITRFEASLADIDRVRARRRETLTDTEDAINEGMDIVRDLDALIRNQYAGDKGALESWAFTRRINRPRAHATTATTEEKQEA